MAYNSIPVWKREASSQKPILTRIWAWEFNLILSTLILSAVIVLHFICQPQHLSHYMYFFIRQRFLQHHPKVYEFCRTTHRMEENHPLTFQFEWGTATWKKFIEQSIIKSHKTAFLFQEEQSPHLPKFSYIYKLR